MSKLVLFAVLFSCAQAGNTATVEKHQAQQNTQMPLTPILFKAEDIKRAVQAPDRGKSKIIPFFGYYNNRDIREGMNWNDGNGFWFLSSDFVSSGPMTFVVKINFKGHLYSFSSTESAFQAGQCMIGGKIWEPQDIELFVKSSPNEARELAGHKYKCGPIKEINTLNLMRNLVGQKFTGHLLEQLKEGTGRANLVAGNNTKETYWGQPFDGQRHDRGLNHLGAMLMDVRNHPGNPGPFYIK